MSGEVRAVFKGCKIKKSSYAPIVLTPDSLKIGVIQKVVERSLLSGSEIVLRRSCLSILCFGINKSITLLVRFFSSGFSRFQCIRNLFPHVHDMFIARKTYFDNCICMR